MSCHPLRNEKGELAIICTRQRTRKWCSVCSKNPGSFLCDGPAPAGTKRKTCDAPLCKRCTRQTLKPRQLKMTAFQMDLGDGHARGLAFDFQEEETIDLCPRHAEAADAAR
jgi:hypothetical protein